MSMPSGYNNFNYMNQGQPQQRAGYGQNRSSGYGSGGMMNGNNRQQGNSGYNRNQAASARQTPQMNQSAARAMQMYQMMNQNQSQPKMPQMNQMMGQTQPQMNQMAGQPQQPQKYYDPEVTFEPYNPSMLGGMGAGSSPGANPVTHMSPESIPAAGAVLPEQNKSPESGAQTFFSAEYESLLNRLGGLAQNERNGALFYEYLSGIARNEKQRQALKEISESGSRNSGLLNDMFKSQKGEAYGIRGTQIDASVGFAEGVKWAAWEESKAIRELADLYEKTDGEKNLKTINAMMHRKIGDLALLMNM